MTLEPIASLAQTLARQAEPPPSLSLTKHYKGITLDQPVRLVSVEANGATIQATQRRTFPCLEGIIHLRSRAFAGAIAARIQPLDYAAGTFWLSDLAFAPWQDRQSERVQPKTPLYVLIRCRHFTCRAFLDDLSPDGMGVLLSQNLDPDGSLRVGVHVRLAFRLAVGLVEHSFDPLKGMIVYRQKVGRQLIKFGLRLYPSAPQRQALQQYVVQRYDEILDELEQEFNRLSQRPRIENLYF